MCLREGQTEIEVTNLSKRRRVSGKKETQERGRLGKDLLQEIHLNIPG